MHDIKYPITIKKWAYGYQTVQIFFTETQRFLNQFNFVSVEGLIEKMVISCQVGNPADHLTKAQQLETKKRMNFQPTLS